MIFINLCRHDNCYAIIYMVNNEVVTRTQRVVLEESGIVKCTAFDNISMTLEDAIENVAAVKTVANGKKVPVLVDLSNTVTASQEARAYFTKPEVAEIQSACAMIVKSLLSQMVGNFFLGLNKTSFPLKLFKNEEEARAWLANYL